MRIAIIGAGIIGVTSAYELAAAGHTVTVFEQDGSIASEASFAHAGLDGPGCALAWSPLSVTGGVLSAAMRGRWPKAITSSAPLSSLAWKLRWMRAHRLKRQAQLLRHQHRLTSYSRTCRLDLTHTLQLDFEQAQGVTLVSRSEADAQRLLAATAAFDRLGVRHQRWTADECRAREPGLSPQAPLHSAVHLPDEGVGNCREFAHLIKQHAQRLGTQFLFHTRVLAVKPGTQPELRFAHEGQPQRKAFDAVVICTGLASPDLLGPLRLRLPLVGVAGLSVTAPLRLDDMHPHLGPTSALLDPRRGVSIVRAGNRLRVSGGARVGGLNHAQATAALQPLYDTLDEWFPGAARTAQAQQWQGTSPALPDDLPVLGLSGVEGVWLNLGHGSLGWAMSCGSARLLAALMDGRTPDIDPDGLGATRFR